MCTKIENHSIIDWKDFLMSQLASSLLNMAVNNWSWLLILGASSDVVFNVTPSTISYYSFINIQFECFREINWS